MTSTPSPRRDAPADDAADQPAAADALQRSVDTQHKRRPQDASQAPANAPLPPLPHERDQSVDMTDGHPDPQAQQAYRDVQRGLQDTDKGPPSDKAYQKQKR